MAELVEAQKAKERPSLSPWASWENVLGDPNLCGLPYKMETNERGQIIMSPPAAPKHGGRQFEIGRLIRKSVQEKGRIVTECPVRTPGGTKAPDVVWFSEARWETAKASAGDSPVAPEICVEVLSPSNTEEEMEEKRSLYFAAGAEEVWLCSTEGAMRFFDSEREREASGRVPGFPKQIDV
jgi:Uma2 family endonuclease